MHFLSVALALLGATGSLAYTWPSYSSSSYGSGLMFGSYSPPQYPSLSVNYNPWLVGMFPTTEAPKPSFDLDFMYSQRAVDALWQELVDRFWDTDLPQIHDMELRDPVGDTFMYQISTLENLRNPEIEFTKESLNTITGQLENGNLAFPLIFQSLDTLLNCDLAGTQPEMRTDHYGLDSWSDNDEDWSWDTTDDSVSWESTDDSISWDTSDDSISWEASEEDQEAMDKDSEIYLRFGAIAQIITTAVGLVPNLEEMNQKLGALVAAGRMSEQQQKRLLVRAAELVKAGMEAQDDNTYKGGLDQALVTEVNAKSGLAFGMVTSLATAAATCSAASV